MQGRTILVVEGDVEIQQLIKRHLRNESFEVVILECGNDVISFVINHKPDLIILGITITGIEGIALCREIRKFSPIPIIIVSSKTDDLDIILGLEVGADDYITKPFSPNQLVARVKANLRRHLLSSSYANKSERLTYTGLEINIDTHTVLLNGTEIPVSPKEFDLLVVLARHPYRAFHIDDLYKHVWGSDSLGDTRTIIVHISTLRKKLENNSDSPKYILTVRGKGYKFNPSLQQKNS